MRRAAVLVGLSLLLGACAAMGTDGGSRPGVTEDCVACATSAAAPAPPTTEATAPRPSTSSPAPVAEAPAAGAADLSCAPGGALPAPAAFPLTLSGDGRYLVDADGRPFLLHGDAAWSLIVQLDLDDLQEYLDARRAQGFNALVVNLIEHHYADDPPRDVYGQEPFTTPGDFSTPNEDYFAHVDDVLAMAAERGFVLLLAPAYLGYGGEEEGWFEEMEDAGPQVLRDYGRYVGERYADDDNIIWLEGGDYTPDDDGMRLVDAVANGIRDRDARHLHAAHWGPETSGSDVDPDWMDLDTTYTYELVYEKGLEDYDGNGGKPRILVESAYEDDIKDTTPRSLRAQAYYALLTGAVGQVYGHGATWQFDAEWRAALDTPGSCGMVHVRNLFARLPWPELRPDEHHRVLVGGAGTFGQDDYATAAVTADGDVAVVYAPEVRTVEVSLDGFSGPVSVRFYDPTDGTVVDAEGSPLRPAGTVDLTPPGRNAMGDTDWVIVLDGSGS
jgi:hypothetical protein